MHRQSLSRDPHVSRHQMMDDESGGSRAVNNRIRFQPYGVEYSTLVIVNAKSLTALLQIGPPLNNDQYFLYNRPRNMPQNEYIERESAHLVHLISESK